jgi:hypothetical protein
MLRKIMAIAAMTMVMASAACNSITGTQEGTTSSNGDPSRRHQEGDIEKVCVEELRAVAITSPWETEQVQDGQLLMVTWDLQEICGRHISSVKVSYDGGQTFSLLGETKDGASMAWRLPRVDGKYLVVQVDVSDAYGVVTDRVALSSPGTAAPIAPGPRPPVQSDI